jgi:pyruvate/2-oxoglutarate dehydrogenase complex dihydrolipoamide acyltransferase (E2) component
MAQTFNLPTVGDTMTEAEIVEWFVQVGDTVDLDQLICSIETDKSVVEMSTPFRGTVLQLGGAPGDVIVVGAPLIVVGEAGETVAASPSAPVANRGPASSPVVRKLAMEHGLDPTKVAGSGIGGRVTRSDVQAAITGTTPAAAPAPVATNSRGLAMPKIRKLAREQSIDLEALFGSGPRGSITAADLVATPPTATDRRERLSAMRRSIARHLTESVQTIPQFTSTVNVDVSAVLATRKAVAQRLDVVVPIDAVLMALMIPVLRDHPIINSALDGDEVVYYGRYDIGVAVDTDDGLMVPVVRSADQLDIGALAAEIQRLADTARNRTIRPEELIGATCTLNNVGALGVISGTPILPLGTSTIVAFGVARPVVQLRNDNAVEVPTMTISATFDHRLVDGVDSGRFLGQLKKHLEVPALSLL